MTPIANNLDLRVAVAHVEEARARAGIAKSYLYPQVEGVGRLRRAGGVDHRQRTTTRRIRAARTGSGCRGKSICSAGCGEGQEAAIALALASEQGRRGVLVTLVGDVATNYFLLRELDLQLEIATTDPPPERRDRHVLSEPPATAVSSNRLELDRIQAHRAQTAASIPALETPDRAGRERSCRCCWDGRLARSRATALTIDERLPPPIPAGLPASLLERRPDVVQAEQVLVAANADIGVAKSLFYPTISLTGFLGGVSGDLTSFLGGSGALWSLGPRAVSADLPGGADCAGTSRRRRRDSTRRSPSTRRRRSTATARWPTRWSRFRSWPNSA